MRLMSNASANDSQLAVSIPRNRWTQQCVGAKKKSYEWKKEM